MKVINHHCNTLGIRLQVPLHTLLHTHYLQHHGHFHQYYLLHGLGLYQHKLQVVFTSSIITWISSVPSREHVITLASKLASLASKTLWISCAT